MVYEEICDKCGSYMYDTENMYQKLFQRIYNASTVLYYKTIFESNKNSNKLESIRDVLVKINSILSEVVFPKEKEENIRNILNNKGFDADKLLLETSILNGSNSQDILSCD